jgi:GDP-4-dehydro-6-deoxy-D-mannose reductase
MDAGRVAGMSGIRLLVTGAGGFCGLHACAFFARQGFDVVGVLRKAGDPRAAVLRRLGAAAEFCELTDRHAVDRLIARVRPEWILHLAGLGSAGPSWREPALYMEANVMAAVYLLESARREMGAGFRLAAAGSMLRFDWPADGGAPRPPHPYSLSKTLLTAVVRSWHHLYGTAAVVAEPANLIGPGPSAGLPALIAAHIRALRRARLAGAPDPSPFRLSSLTERRDYVDVRDAVRAYGVLLERGEPGRVYPIATGRQRTLGEVAAAYERAAGFRVEWLIGDSDEPSPPPADPSALLALGWRPEIPFARSVADTLDDNAGSVAWFMRTQRSGDG